jgi:hypothetical protein
MTDIKTRAREIAENCPGLHRQDFGGDALAFIAAALLSAQNEAYERAATIAVQNAQNAFLSGSSDGQTIAFSIATAIRALKTEEAK